MPYNTPKLINAVNASLTKNIKPINFGRSEFIKWVRGKTVTNIINVALLGL
jgi:hypothetical protein